MPTYRHQATGKRFLFVHIPRTGGRFFESNLEENGWVVEHKRIFDRSEIYIKLNVSISTSQTRIWDSVEGIEIAHFHRELYEKYLDVDDIPHIAIVRNPIDKFFSASIYLKRMYGDDIQEVMEEDFYSKMKKFPCSQAVNWFRPQVDFLSDKTQVWRFEDGFGKQFAEWVSEIVDVPFYINPTAEVLTDRDEGINKVDKTPTLLDKVSQFVRRDIEHLYPELDSSLQEGEKTKT